MFNPVVSYGVGGLVCGLLAFGAYFMMERSGAAAATHPSTGLNLRTVPLACGPAIQATALNPVTAVPGKACACVQQTFLAAISAPERPAAADLVTLIAETERAAARGVSADLSPYFEGVARLQNRYALDGRTMGNLVERVNATLDACVSS